MIVVSNATPLIYLAKGNLLSILPTLYTEVWIPPEIYNETVPKGVAKGYQDALRIQQACGDWLKQRAPTIDLLAVLMQKQLPKLEQLKIQLRHLQSGEIKALALAIEMNADRIIFDDRAALEIAEQLEKHFPFLAIGTGSVLDEARQQSIISVAEYQSFLEVFHEAIAWV
jgi:predicted nucleic acid-binding protein